MNKRTPQAFRAGVWAETQMAKAKKTFDWENTSKFKHPRSMVAIVAVVLVAVALIVTGVLLAVLQTGSDVPTVSTISLAAEKIGMSADLDAVYVKIIYNDNSSREVSLSQLMPQGLDLTYAGQQTVTINYGNQSWSFPVTVVSANIVLSYTTSDGGTIEGDAYQEIPAGQNGATVRAVAKEGYHFVGWNDGLAAATRNESAVSRDLAPRALFERNSYTVAFQRADGRWDDQTVLYGDSAVVPDSNSWKLKNYGYKFVGWDASVASQINNVTGDLLVRGTYLDYHTGFTVSVTGDVNNEKDIDVSAVNHKFGSSDQIVSRGTANYLYGGKTYSRPANVYNGFYAWDETAVVSVKAAQGSILDRWLVKTADGSWVEIGRDASVVSPLPTANLAVPGDESRLTAFSSGRDRDTGDYQLTFKLNPNIDENAVLEVVAVMEYIENTITFYNNSIVVEAAENVFYKRVDLPYTDTLTAADLLAPEGVSEGYVWDGWYIAGTATKVDTSTVFTEDTALVTKWDTRKFKVYFDRATSDYSGPEYVEVDYKSAIGNLFPTSIPSAEKMVFEGWFDTNNRAVTESTVVNSEIRLHPVFSPIQHTLSFNVIDGHPQIAVAINGGGAQIISSDNYYIEEVSSYVFTISWDADFRFNAISVTAATATALPVTAAGSVDIAFDYVASSGVFTNTLDTVIDIDLKLKEFSLDITNGADGNNGTVSLTGYEAVGDEFISKTYTVGSQVEYAVAAPENMVVASVVVDGGAPISPLSATYTGLFGNYSANHTVVITYAVRSYQTAYRVDGNAASQVLGTKLAGELYSVTIPEVDGKYISKIVYNGSAINPYQFASGGGYRVNPDSVAVNYRQPTAAELAIADSRVTMLEFIIDAVFKDVDLTVYYSDISYVLSFESEGHGSVLTAAEVEIARDGGLDVGLSTSTGYYVSGYVKTENGVATTINYVNFKTKHTESLSGVREDATYKFIFKRQTFSVLFSTNGSINVTADGLTARISGVSAYVADYGSNKTYDLEVADGYYISALSVTAQGAAAESRPLGDFASAYSLVLNNIKSQYTVDITVSEKPVLPAPDGVLSINSAVGGKVTAPLGNGYVRGQELVLTVLPYTGYHAKNIIVSGRVYTPTATEVAAASYTITLTAAETDYGSISVVPYFEAESFVSTLTIDSTSNGGGRIAVGASETNAVDKTTVVGGVSTDAVTYGEMYYVYFIADTGSFIESISIDGVVVELSTLKDYTIKTTNQKYAVGRLELPIVGDVSVLVNFRKDIFTVTVLASSNGITEVLGGTAGFENGEDVPISLEAATGYHISALYVNGVEIEGFLDFSGANAKYNSKKTYTYSGIDRNITVVAEYDLNYYNMDVSATNVSQNFAGLDTGFASYGKLDVAYSGAGTPSVSTSDGLSEYAARYSGIAHGDQVTLSFGVNLNNGYYLKSLTLKFLSGATVSYPVTDGTVHGGDFGMYIVSGTRLALSLVLKSVTWDIYEISAEYSRQTYTVSATFNADSSGEGPANGVGLSFINDKSISSVAIVSGAGNSYVAEYGLRYTVTVTPVASHKLLSFTTTSGGDYTSSVRLDGTGNNVYTNYVRADTAFVAEYVKKTFEVTLNVNGDEYGSGTIGNTSLLTETFEYGSEVRFDFRPYDSTAGGYISRFILNNSELNVSSFTEQNWGSYSTYHYTQIVTSNIVASVFFSRMEYDVRADRNIAGGNISLFVAADEAWTGKVLWGDTVNVSVSVFNAYDIESVSYNNGTGPQTLTIAPEMYDYTTGVKRLIFAIPDVKADYDILIDFALKTFDVELNAVANGTISVHTDGSDVELSTVTATTAVQIDVKPHKGYVISTVSIKMETLSGVEQTLTLGADYYSATDVDYIRYTIDDVSGKITVAVTFSQKHYRLTANLIGIDGSFDAIYGLSLLVSGGGENRGSLNMNTYAEGYIDGVVYGDVITLTLKAGIGFDVSSIILNNRNYLLTGEGVNYNFGSDTYSLTLTVNDSVVNNRDEDGNLLSGGTDLALRLNVSSLKDVFQVVFDVADDGSIVTVTAPAAMTYGVRSIVDVSVKTGYSITAIKVLEYDGYDSATPSYTLLTDEGARLTEFRFNMTVGAMHGIYQPQGSGVRKYVKFVVEYEINTYGQSLVEYVHDVSPSTINANLPGVASTTTATYVDYETRETLSFVGDSTLVKHYSQVTIETAPIGSVQYVFWGFQEKVDGEWVAEKVADGKNGVTFVPGSANKFTYIAEKSRTFRAIYVKQYILTVEIVPFHKSTTGLYVPEANRYINYLSYASVAVDAVDPFDNSKTTLTNVSSLNSQFQYAVKYGFKALIKGSDSNAANRSTAVEYYTATAGGGYEQVAAVEATSTEVTVEGNVELFAVFNNNIQFAMTYDTVGGSGGEGATVVYRVNGDIPKTLSENAFTVGGLDIVTMTVSIKENYRFDGLLRLVAQDRNATGALKWTTQWESLFDFIADGSDSGVAGMSDGVTYVSGIDSNVSVVKNGDILAFSIRVVDNSIYKLKMYKTYRLDVDCVNGYSSDGATPNIVAGNAALSTTVTNNRAVDGRFDYGATVTLTSVAPSGDSQFVGWFIDGVNYFDLSTLSYRSAAEAAATEFTLSGDYVIGKTALSIVAEYLPIYRLYLQNALTINGTDFSGVTSETSMSTVWYDSTVVNTVVSKESIAEDFSGVLAPHPILSHRVRFDLGTDDKNTSIINNRITLKVLVNPSYVFSTYSIRYGTSGAWTEISDSAAKSEYSFDLVAYLTANPTAETDIYFKANISKKNTVRVSKVVYYDAFGEISQSQGLAANVAYTGTSQSSASTTTDYQSNVVVNVSTGESYLFLGWYDITSDSADNTITSIGDLTADRLSGLESYTFSVEKSGDSYTYFLEARFIRLVTVTFAVENNSANKNQSFMYQVPYIKGNAANASAVYEGQSVATANTATGEYAVDSASATSVAGRHTVTKTMYAGTYVEYSLTNTSNADGFNPSNHYFINMASGSYATKAGNKYTFVFDINRTITVLYGAYGTINFSGILPAAVVTFGPSFTQQYLEMHSEVNTANGVYDAAGSFTLRIVGGKLVMTNVSTSTITISINNMPKVDYQTSIDPDKVASYEMVGIWVKPMFANATIECDISIGFSYQSETGLTLDYPMDMMPFMRGQGIDGDPYIIRTAAQLAGINTVYELSGRTFGSTYKHFKMDTMLRDLSAALPDAQRYLYLGEWEALCAEGNGFDGVFDASGWEIGGMTGTPSTDYYGVFGKLSGAKIISFNFGGRNALEGTGNYYGIIAGLATNTIFENVNLKDNRTQFKNGDTSVGSFGTSGNYLGLVAGKASDCEINGGVYIRSAIVNGGGKYVDVEDVNYNIVRTAVDGKYVGAMFGWLENTDVGVGSSSMVFELDNVTVKGHLYVGGVAGYFVGAKTIDGVIITSGWFGISELSANVGGIVGYLDSNATLSNAAVGTSSTTGFYIYGVYRSITSSMLINQNLPDRYIYESTVPGQGASAIGGFVGINYGTVSSCHYARGTVSLYGSVAGGMVGVNFGYVNDVSIAAAAKVAFDLEYGGVYGGIVGYNGYDGTNKGFVNYAKIGSLNTFQGLTSDVSKVVPKSGGLVEKANVTFLGNMQSSVGSAPLSGSSGTIFETWGGCAMGGVVGYNVGKVYNSVTYGKIVNHKRLYSGSETLDALGGIVGMNVSSQAEVRSCGASYSIVLGFTVVNTETGMSGSQYRALGGVVGFHFGGIVMACFNFHSAVSNFIYTGVSSGSLYPVHSEFSGVAGVLSSPTSMASSESYLCWSYYTTTSYNTGYIGTHNLGNSGAVVNLSSFLWPTFVNGVSAGGQNANDVQFNRVAFTSQNYNTYVNSTNGHVYNVKGKTADLGDFANAAGENVTRAGYAVRNYYTAAAKVYAVNLDGTPSGTELRWQYNTSR